MRKWLTSVLMGVLVLSGCGGGDDGTADPTVDQPTSTEAQDDAGDNHADPGDNSAGEQPSADSESDSDGSSDAPTPEGDGPLPPNSIRIGDEIFERMEGASLSDCYVQEGTPPFSINGALNDDDKFRFSVYYVDEGVYEAQIQNDEIYWVSAPIREGTELEVEWDVGTQTISGTGLFNDAFLGEWAYGSFEFTCSDG